MSPSAACRVCAGAGAPTRLAAGRTSPAVPSPPGQVLPFCSEETLEQLEKNLSGLPSVTRMLQAGDTPQSITDRILDGIGTAGQPLAVTPK